MSGAKNDRKTKSKSMAAHLKKHNVIRTTTQCPRCHLPVGLNAVMLNHLNNCKGRPKRSTYKG